MSGLLLFQLSAAAAFCVLLYHSFRKRGMLTTVLFLGIGIDRIIRKERDTMLSEKLYKTNENLIQVFDIPVAVVVGWLFTFYVSWSLAELILENRKPEKSRSLFPILSLMMPIVACIAICMETTGAQMGWWQWNQETSGVGQLPLVTGFLWPYVTWPFMLPFLLFAVQTNIPILGNSRILRLIIIYPAMTAFAIFAPALIDILGGGALLGSFLPYLLFWFIPWIKITYPGEVPEANSTRDSNTKAAH